MWVWESGRKIDPATGVSFHRSFFLRKSCIYLYLLPIPSNPLITFWNGRSLPSWGVLWGASSLNVTPLKYHRQNCTKKAVVQNIIISGTMLIITIKFYLPPTDHPTPKNKIGENWEHSFSGVYLSFRGTKLSCHFQWDILLRPLISFFLSLVWKTQANHWNKRMLNTRLTT